MESAIWRPFWQKLKKSDFWIKLKSSLQENIEDLLIGEMTGGDRALISSLEGFEDLRLMGKLQLEDRGIVRGDVVFCITEGGETSSVLGALMAAVEQYGTLTQEKIAEARNNLFFIYNNPDEILKPFDRSRAVIDNPAVSKINLTTGPQAITGSTRMQATTSETFVMGLILEAGIFKFLKEYLNEKELSELGFPMSLNLMNKLLSFENLRNAVSASIEDIEKLTLLESLTYHQGGRTTYFAKKALITVFTDCAERSPTFHPDPLDPIQIKERKCWIQVWTESRDYKQAWRNFLGRDFRGLEKSFYKSCFLKHIDDEYLKNSALSSLSKAGKDQEKLYDFSFSQKNISTRGPKAGDLGVLVCIDEEIEKLADPKSSFSILIDLSNETNAQVALILAGEKKTQEVKDIINRLPGGQNLVIIVNITISSTDDPMNLKKHTALKILLNTHSTAVMARLGRVVGNTMTNVYPSNLKLIGRATYLILSHVNDTVSQAEWIKSYGKTDLISYAEANAVLFDARDVVTSKSSQISEVELAIIRILETLRKNSFLCWEKALTIAQDQGLESYLEKYNPALRTKQSLIKTRLK